MDELTFKNELQRHLTKSLGKDVAHATTFDWRSALALTLRDTVVDTWFDSTRKTYQSKGKRVYYLSMESISRELQRLNG